MEQGEKDGDKITETNTESTASCKITKTGYYKWKCVSQKCKNCKDIKPMLLTCQNSDNLRKVSQFETTKILYTKTDNNGNVVNKI